MRWLMGAVFATTMLGILSGAHYYVWRRAVRDTSLPRLLRWALSALIITLGVSLPVGFAVSRLTEGSSSRPLSFGGFFWMGLLFYTVLLMATADAGKGIWRLVTFLKKKLETRRERRRLPAATEKQKGKRRDGPADPSRRLFFTRAAAAGSVLGAGGIGILGARSAHTDIQTPEIPVELDRLPPQLSGFRIAVLSDLHLGLTLGRDFTLRAVELTHRQKPDAVVIVGDLVDGSVDELREAAAPLGSIRAPQGVFFVTGNHEYYSGAKEWIAHLEKLGIRVLGNERVSLGDTSPGGSSFDLAGVYDRRGGWFFPDHQPDVEKAVEGRDPERELVVLAHQPNQITETAVAEPGLQISGHTHGGQIWPWTLAVSIAEPYVKGLHRHNERTQIFVTRGVGYWGPPIRVLAPPEIPCLVLHS